MKRVLQLLLLAFVVPPTLVRAQISFTSADFQPPIGSTRHAETFTASPTRFTPDYFAIQTLAAQTGASQTFDLTAFTFDAPDPITTAFLDYDSAGPGGGVAAFSAAEYVVEVPASLNPGLPGDSYGFYSVEANQFGFHGTLTPGLAQIEHVPAEVVYEFPLEFGGSWASTHTTTSTLPTGTTVRTITVQQEVDAWGTLVTPAGSFSALRLRISRATSENGVLLFTEEEIEFVTKEGVTAHMGYDLVFQQWGSVSYTVETTDPGETGMNGGVLFVVDDSTALAETDAFVQEAMTGLALDVTIMSDEAVSIADATGRELIVVSASIDTQVLSGDWSPVEVPLLTWDPAFFSLLRMTGGESGSDFGVTPDATRLMLGADSHPISNGSSGEFDVYDALAPMAFGVPGSAAAVVAASILDPSRATVFTYEANAPLVDDGPAPARRVGFFLGDDVGNVVTEVADILLENAILWALGRENEIARSVSVVPEPDREATFQLGQNYPNPATSITWIPFTLPRPASVKVNVFDILGRHVARMVEGEYPGGSHQISFNPGNLSAGAYLYRLEVDGQATDQRMIVTH